VPELIVLVPLYILFKGVPEIIVPVPENPLLVLVNLPKCWFLDLLPDVAQMCFYADIDNSPRVLGFVLNYRLNYRYVVKVAESG